MTVYVKSSLKEVNRCYKLWLALYSLTQKSYSHAKLMKLRMINKDKLFTRSDLEKSLNDSSERVRAAGGIPIYCTITGIDIAKYNGKLLERRKIVFV